MPAALPRVLVAGGGVAALEAVLALLERAPQAPVRMIAVDTHFLFRPLSLVEPFGSGAGRPIALAALGDRGVALTRGRVCGYDVAARSVECSDGRTFTYDALVVAVGARAVRPFEHALTFRGGEDAHALHGLLQDIDSGSASRIAFVAPPGVAWTLPLYQLALQAAARAAALSLTGVEIVLVTPEQRPLEVFGRTGSALAECLLAESGVELVCGAAPRVRAPRRLDVAPGEVREVDRVVTLSRLTGPALAGLPAGAGGFLDVDAAGRVAGAEHVYAAGDVTGRAVKQAGLAAQQADAAVDALLADFGLAEPNPPEPACLRALLTAGEEVWYLRRAEGEPDGEVSRRPLWWPLGKSSGRHLAPFLEAQETWSQAPPPPRLTIAHR